MYTNFSLVLYKYNIIVISHIDLKRIKLLINHKIRCLKVKGLMVWLQRMTCSWKVLNQFVCMCLPPFKCYNLKNKTKQKACRASHVSDESVLTWINLAGTQRYVEFSWSAHLRSDRSQYWRKIQCSTYTVGTTSDRRSVSIRELFRFYVDKNTTLPFYPGDNNETFA